jgi:hypothetical protein
MMLHKKTGKKTKQKSPNPITPEKKKKKKKKKTNKKKKKQYSSM